MSATAIYVEWNDSVEVFAIDLTRMRKGVQLTHTTETCPHSKPSHYEYNTSSKFVADSKGGGLLRIYYKETHNKHLKGLRCRWGEALLWLNRPMQRGKVEWKDAADWGNRRKVYSTVDSDNAEWQRLERLPCKLTKRERETVERAAREQKLFRDRLLMIDPKCAITGERQTESLEAAHVLAVARGGSDIESNGVLLRADLHRLFDAGLFAITRAGRVSISKKLESPHYRRLLGEFSAVRRETFERIRDAWKHSSK